jgi:putative ABC transport system permease protein
MRGIALAALLAGAAVNRTLWAASLRHLLRHPAQLALALLGLALGVATIAAVDIATASSARAFQLSMEAVNGSATHQILGGPSGIDERQYVELRKHRAGVEMAPIVEGYVSIGDRTMQLLGIDPLANPSFRQTDVASASATATAGKGATSSANASATTGVRIDSVSAWFTQRGAVMMAERTASQLGLTLHRPFTLDIGGHTESATLIGYLPGDQPGYDALIFTDIANAQEWLHLIGKLSRIDLKAGADDRALASLRAQLPTGLEVVATRQRSQQSLDMTSAFTVNLQAMSLLALLVSLFLIYSAISFAVVQRRRTVSVLRALGATRSAVLTMLLVEAGVLGVIGATAGLFAGLSLGKELVALVSRTINDLYFVVAVNDTTLPMSSIVKAMGAGIGVSLIAALLPAMEAANSSPQLGGRRSVLEERAVNLSRWLVIASIVFAVASGAIVYFSGRNLTAGFVSLFLLLVSVAAIAPAALRVSSQFAARIAGAWSPIARLAFGDIAASLSRTGVAVAALGLAVSAMLGVSIMVESFRESLREWLTQTMRADVYVTAPGPGFGRPERKLEPEVVKSLVGAESVRAYTANRRAIAESPYGPIGIDALSLIPESLAGFHFAMGDPKRAWAAFDRGALIVSEPLSWRLQLKPGSRLALATPGGKRDFEVAGVYREYGNDRGNVLMNRSVYQAIWRDDDLTALGLYLKPGSDVGLAIQRLREAGHSRQALLIRSNADIRDLSMKIFERTFTITRVLYWLAAGVAAIALVSALLAWELERSRELAIVRAIGLTPRGAAVLVEAQTAFMGVGALVAALPAGVLTGVLLIEVINRRAFGWQIDLHLRPAQFGNALLLSISAALIAGLYPAWRTGRAPIATEVREE